MANEVIAKPQEESRMTNWIQQLKTSTFVREVSLTFSTKIAILIIGFISSIITARYLGSEGRGIYIVLMTIIGLAMQFGNLGLHAANTYFVAQNRDLLPKIVGNTICLSFSASIIIAFFTLTLVLLRPSLITGIPLSLVIIALLSIPFSLLLMLGENILLGIQQIKAFNLLEFMNQIVTLCIIAILLVILGQEVESVIVTNTLMNIFLSIIIVRYLRSLGGIGANFDISLFKQMIGYSLKVYLSALFFFLVARFDILMVNYFLGSSDVGIYSIAVQMTNLLYMLPVTISLILFPIVSAMKESSWQFVKKTAQVTALIMFGLCAVTALLARPFILFFYGQEFIGAVEALWWLLPGVFLLSITYILNGYLLGKGMPMILVYSPLIAAVINLLLNLYFISKWGIKGASFTSSIAYSVMFIGSLAYLKMSSIKNG